MESKIDEFSKGKISLIPILRETCRLNDINYGASDITVISYMDGYICNAGPGITEVSYRLTNFQDKNGSNYPDYENGPVVLGPGACIKAVPYLMTGNPQAVSANIIRVLRNYPTLDGSLPWKVEVVYNRRVLVYWKKVRKEVFNIYSRDLVTKDKK